MLPWYYGDSKIMQQIIRGDADEICAARKTLLHIIAQYYVDTATEDGVILWEQELGLTPRKGSSIDLRKAQIKAKLQRPAIMTPRQIESIVNLFLTQGIKAHVIEMPGTYHFRIDIPFGSLLWRAEMEQAVDAAKPAHLGYNIRYTLLNHELEDSIPVGGKDFEDFDVWSALPIEERVPYGRKLNYPAYDKTRRYGGGRMANGHVPYDRTCNYSGIDKATNWSYGKPLSYQFIPTGAASADGAYTYQGLITYNGEAPQKLEYDDLLDELATIVMFLSPEKGEFDDSPAAIVQHNGLMRYTGDHRYGDNPSALDADGGLEIRRYHRYNGHISHNGGDINITDGSLSYNMLHRYDGGMANQYDVQTISDRLGGALDYDHKAKNIPYDLLHPRLVDNVDNIVDSMAAETNIGGMDDVMLQRMQYDNVWQYNGQARGGIMLGAVADAGGTLEIIRGIRCDGSIDYTGVQASDRLTADGTTPYNHTVTYKGGTTYVLRRQSALL